ncbi:MAG: PIG-L family deacetylase [Actinobacteria bacterium]|nr:PIG-L family deacetylase [Actinomycetota bacterium]
MPTIVFFHAHPDDEASQSSGSMARAVAEGYRVVVVYATNGEHGEVPDDLAPGETVIERRRKEAEKSAAILGTHRIEWLGYSDSGMNGWEQNSHAAAFHQANLSEAGLRLAEILDREDADVLVGYDWHGGYGHPDHVKVHHVTHAAARLAARRPRVLEGTMNRDVMRRLYQGALAAGQGDQAWDPDQPMDDGNPFGSGEHEIHWAVDVREYLPQKRAALAAHASQKTDIEGLLGMPEEVFAIAFGHEHYIEPDRMAAMEPGWPFSRT